MGCCLGNYAGLFMDFFLHEMLIAVFVIAIGIPADRANFAICEGTVVIPNGDRLAG